MSGIKTATVQPTLGRVLVSVRAAAEESARAVAAACSAGERDCAERMAAAERVHAGLRRTLPVDLLKWLAGETKGWEKLLRRHDKSHEAARRQVERAARKVEDSLECQRRRLGELSQIESEAWNLSMDDARAQSLKNRAESVRSDMRRAVSSGEQAREARREAMGWCAEAEGLAQDAEMEYDRLVALAEARRERQRIAEENERRSKELADDLESLRKAIERRKGARGWREAYPHALEKETREVLSLVGNGKYEEALAQEEALKTALEEAAGKIDEGQRAWEAAKVSAERAVADAREEAGRIARGELEKFAGAPAEEIASAYRELDSVGHELDAGRVADADGFADAEKRAAAALGKLRAWRDRASERRQMEERRDELANAILDVLEESGYDVGARYEGEQRETLRLTAGVAGGVGDVVMRMALDGRTQFEVKGIPVGEETLCHDRVRGWVERLAERGVVFDVTDWGRAEEVARERSAPPDEPPDEGGMGLRQEVSRDDGMDVREAWR